MIAQAPTPPALPDFLEQASSTITSFYKFAPIGTVVLSIFLLGFALAWWARGHEIKQLESIVEYLKQGRPQ